jgi:uncharacterized membrane protein
MMMQKRQILFWISAVAIAASVGVSIVLVLFQGQEALLPQAYFIPMALILPLSLVAGGCITSVIPSWRKRHSTVIILSSFCFAIALFILFSILSARGFDVGNLEDPSLPASLFCAFGALSFFGVGSYDRLSPW